MLTIFSIPKPFVGHINIIQRNAIKSWISLFFPIQVILFGNEEGVEGAAEEFDIEHIPEIKTNEFGTPLLNSAFNIAQARARNNILVYLNADIILTSDLIPAISKIRKPLFLANGRRIDLDVDKEIDFSDVNWEKNLRQKIFKNGKLHGYSGIDYLIFPKYLPYELPDFAVGRLGWDNWLIYNIRRKKIPVIDATEVITAVHQNHSFSHSPFANEKKKRVEGPEVEKSFKLAGGLSNMLTIREADWILRSEGLKKPEFPRIIFSKLALFYPWRLLLGLKRKIQNLL